MYQITRVLSTSVLHGSPSERDDLVLSSTEATPAPHSKPSSTAVLLCESFDFPAAPPSPHCDTEGHDGRIVVVVVGAQASPSSRLDRIDCSFHAALATQFARIFHIDCPVTTKAPTKESSIEAQPRAWPRINLVSMAMDAYCQRLVQYWDLPREAWLYALHIATSVVACWQLNGTYPPGFSLETARTKPSHLFLATCAMLAAKLLCDKPETNGYYAHVSGFVVADMNAMEKVVMEAFDYVLPWPSSDLFAQMEDRFIRATIVRD